MSSDDAKLLVSEQALLAREILRLRDELNRVRTANDELILRLDVAQAEIERLVPGIVTWKPAVW